MSERYTLEAGKAYYMEVSKWVSEWVGFSGWVWVGEWVSAHPHIGSIKAQTPNRGELVAPIITHPFLVFDSGCHLLPDIQCEHLDKYILRI